MLLKTRGVFSSHGEILRAALFSLPVRKGAVLLVDEPEAGQDLDGLMLIRKGFDRIVAAGGQVLVATHHPLVWRDAHVIEPVPGHLDRLRRAFCSDSTGDGR
jgi:predicted ATPase